MERFFFRRIEVWLVLLLLILFAAACLCFAAYILRTERRSDLPGPIGQAALSLAETPLNAIRLLTEPDPRVAIRTAKLRDRSGWTLPDGATGLPGEDYLLLSRFDGAKDQAIVELVDLRDMSVRHRWTPDADQLFAGVPPSDEYSRRWSRHYFEAVHPLLLDDGSLILKEYHSPLFRVDTCAQPVWTEQSLTYHHSVMLAADGTLWTPSHYDPPKPRFKAKMEDDALANLTLDGKLLSVTPLVDLMLATGLKPDIFGPGDFISDPIHLNDIEPVLIDGPHWRKGDLFLSIRHLSTIMLYRPSTREIVWMKRGPWMGQHDVDVLDAHRISIFNNNAGNWGAGPEIDGANEVLIYDFTTDTVTSPLQATMADAEFKTFSEGLQDRTSLGNYLVEEENSGRLMVLSPAGRQLAEFVNRAADGQIYTTSWSRVIPRDLGERALAAIAAHPCATP